MFELTKEDKIGWKIKIMFVFLNTPVTKKKGGDVDTKNQANEKPKKTKQATKNDKNKNTKGKKDITIEAKKGPSKGTENETNKEAKNKTNKKMLNVF